MLGEICVILSVVLLVLFFLSKNRTFKLLLLIAGIFVSFACISLSLEPKAVHYNEANNQWVYYVDPVRGIMLMAVGYMMFVVFVVLLFFYCFNSLIRSTC